MSIVFPLFPIKNFGPIAPSSAWTQDRGVDIAAPGHTPLLAVADGTIVGHGLSGFGADTPIMRIDSGELRGQYVYYGHAGPLHELPVGTKVKAGDVIGEVGAGIVGHSTGPHLEIGINTSPFPAAIGATSARMLQLLTGATRATEAPLNAADNTTHDLGGGADAQTGGVNTGAQEATLLSQAGGDIAGKVLGLLWGAIGGSAMKVLLYLLLVGGGLALALGGAKHLARAGGPPKPKAAPA